MPTEDEIQKLIDSCQRRGLTKEAGFFESLLQKEEKNNLPPLCPACVIDGKVDPKCRVCKGRGLIISEVPDDSTDLLVSEELGLNEKD